MAVIEVNYQALRDMAKTIDTYCQEQDAQMAKTDACVKDLLYAHWLGPDAMEFGKSWESVDTSGSTAANFRRALQSYSRILNTCASIYQKAQEDIYNLSCTLPR